MERKKPVNTIHSIQQEIKDQKRAKQMSIMKRILKWVLILIAGIALAFGVFLYDKSEYSKVNTVYVNGNHFVSDLEVLEAIEFELGTSLFRFLASSLNDRVPHDSFIESIEVKKHWFNQAMTIDVTEKNVIGYRFTDIIEMVAEDGSIQGLLEGQLSFLQDLPRFTGFDETESLLELVDGISRTDKILYSNVSEIIREPKSYDENYLKIIMADGVQLNTSIYSLESLDAVTFKEIFNRLDENQKCIVYDVFWPSTYAKPCEDAIEELEVNQEIEE